MPIRSGDFVQCRDGDLADNEPCTGVLSERAIVEDSNGDADSEIHMASKIQIFVECIQAMHVCLEIVHFHVAYLTASSLCVCVRTSSFFSCAHAVNTH